LDDLLSYLDAPETPWLLEDPNSSVLITADLYMPNRPYANDTAAQQDSIGVFREGDEEDAMNGSGKVGRDTHGMKAVHAYLLQQGPRKPPLRSLVELTLARHISDFRGSVS
jgi:hypothetical protein